MYNNTTTTDPIQEQDRQHPKNLLFLTDERVLRYGLTSEQDYGNTYDITDLRQAYPANDLWYHKNRVIREKELFVLVFLQDSVRQVTMPHQLDRTAYFSPTIPQRHSLPGDNAKSRLSQAIFFTIAKTVPISWETKMIAPLFIDLFQELIKTRLESFIHIRIRLIQDQYLRTGDNRTPQ